MGDPLVIYGASGYTGALLARALRDRGIAPRLCGRSESKIAALAARLGLEYRIARLDDEEGLSSALAGSRAMLNAAGPFSATALPLVAACLRGGIHYLDVTGEASVIESVSRRGEEARRKGVMLMPAIGFDVVASDCLAAHVARRVAQPRRLFIGVSGLELLSRGSAKTIVAQSSDPVWVRRDGFLERVPQGSFERFFDYGSGPRSSLVVSWGDVVSAYASTGIPDIAVYFETTPLHRVHNALMHLLGWSLPFTPWRDWLRANADALPDGPSEEARAARQAVIVAEVEDDAGALARSRLRTPEAYSFTAAAATAIAERVLAGDIETGFQTASRVFGPDFVLSLPRVHREDF